MLTLRLDYEPQGAMEKAGSALGLVSQRVEGDLKRFQNLLQSRATETRSSGDPGTEAKGTSGVEYDNSGMSGLK